MLSAEQATYTAVNAVNTVQAIVTAILPLSLLPGEVALQPLPASLHKPPAAAVFCLMMYLLFLLRKLLPSCHLCRQIL
jgi:hypothetical protein